jgi:hypothetical protein
MRRLRCAPTHPPQLSVRRRNAQRRRYVVSAGLVVIESEGEEGGGLNLKQNEFGEFRNLDKILSYLSSEFGEFITLLDAFIANLKLT